MGGHERRRLRAPRWLQRLLVTSTVISALAGAIVPTMASAVPLPPPAVNNPPQTGQIISFPQRDYVSASGWQGLYPFVDVEVLRPNPVPGGPDVRIGYAPNVVPDPTTGLVEVNHPGGACWGSTGGGAPAVTPDIKGGDKIRLTARNGAGVVQVIDETTTAGVTITSFVSRTGPNTVEMQGMALRANGTPIAAAELEARLVSGAKDRFDINGKRDIRSPGTGSFAIDATGHWVANFTGLSAADVTRALAAENRIIWLGTNPAAVAESTIYEVGSLVAPGPAANCTAPLQGAVVAPDRGSVQFPATDIGTTSAAERIRITNAGNGTLANLAVTSLALGGADAGSFTVTPASDCVGASVAVGATCDVFITFSPATTGIKEAVLNILSNAGNSVVPITATGLGTDGTPVAYGLALPGTLGFGTRAVGNTSPAQTVAVRNLGNTNLTISSRLVAGAAAADFALLPGDDCDTVAPNASCTLSLTFRPGAEGDRAATLTLAGNATVTIPLTGAGLITTGLIDPPTPPMNLGVFPARDFVSFGGFDADEVVTFQVIRHGVVIGTATSTAAADGIAEVNHPGGGCWDAVTPDLRANDIVRVTRDAAHGGVSYQTTTADVNITARALETAPGSGIVQMHGYARDLATGARLPIDSIEARIIASTADPFAINGRRAIRTPGEGSIAYDPVGPGNPDGINWTATFDLSLSPTVAHDVNLAQTEDNRILWLGRDPLALTELTFWEDAPGIVAPGPSANCTAPLAAPSPGIVVTPQNLTFPGLAAGETATRTLSVRNIGNAALNIGSVTFAGGGAADFDVVGLPGGSIAPNTVGTIQVRFKPSGTSALGASTATVLINDDVVGSPHTATVTGTVVGTPTASLTLSATALTFPETQVAVDSAPRTVTITNEGGSALSLTSIAGGGDFRVVAGATSCAVGVPVASGNTCDVFVVFRPSTVGTRTGTLTIASNDPAGPHTVALTGTSTVTVDGVNDPPVSPHDIEVFPVRDYIMGQGFAAGEFVRFDLYRGGALLRSSALVSPVDLNPADTVFDGFVEVNHLGGVCWTTATPDIQPGDVVRAVRLNGAGVVLGADQTHVMDVDVAMPPVQVAPGTVVFTGKAIDPTTGLALPAGQLEGRIISKNLFTVNGRRTIRAGAGGEGQITVSGTQWTATFTGLSAADVASAVGGSATTLWLGHVPLALNELTHAEYGEIPGPDPSCAGTAPFNDPVPTTDVAAVTFPFGGVGLPSATTTVTFTNPAGSPAAVTVTANPVIEGYHPGDFSIVPGAATTCVTGTALAAGATCTIGVRFTAAATGTRAATIRLPHTGANLVTFVPVTGTGVSAPTITSATSPVGRGGTVTITGTQLLSTTGVTIGGVNAAFTVVSDTVVTATVPNGSPAGVAVPLVVVAAGGTTSITIQVNPTAPTITSVAPVTGAIGTQVTINGTGFTGANVTFNGTAAAIVSNSGTQIVTLVPVGATTGLLKVENLGGAATTGFTVIPPPTVTTFSPATAKTGALLTVNGTNFNAAATVTFRTSGGGSVSAPITLVSATQLRVTIPASAVQGPVMVTTTAGSGSAVFTVEQAPAAITFAPATGTIGSTVTISGENFLQTSKVQFAGKNATSFTVVNENTITAVVPTGATTGTLQIGNKWGSTNSVASFTVIVAPTITGIAPASGSASAPGGGAQITVTGSGFLSATSLSLVQGANVVARPFTIVSGTSITFRVGGVAPGLYTVRITNPAGTVSSVAVLTVTA